jgi:hypothetical protein
MRMGLHGIPKRYVDVLRLDDELQFGAGKDDSSCTLFGSVLDSVEQNRFLLVMKEVGSELLEDHVLYGDSFEFGRDHHVDAKLGLQPVLEL